MHAHVNTAANAITRRPQTHTAMDPAAREESVQEEATAAQGATVSRMFAIT